MLSHQLRWSILFGLFAFWLMAAGCVSSTPPPQFELGGVVAPPAGCVEGRLRGVDC